MIRSIIGHSPGQDWSTLPQSITPNQVLPSLKLDVPLAVQEDRAMHNHGDKYAPEGSIYYDGYSETAPTYHIWRCRGAEDCPYTRISYCVDKAKYNRGKPENMHKTCSVCEAISLEGD